MSRVTDIDTSVIHALEELHRSLEKRDVEGPRVKLKNVSWAITTLALKRTAAPVLSEELDPMLHLRKLGKKLPFILVINLQGFGEAKDMASELLTLQ
ncbi:hypothetical protein HN51_015873 [Arachis hypogaea]